MNVFTESRAYVLADAAIAAIVGTRIYPVKLPQTIPKPGLPAITILRVDELLDAVLKGRASTGTARLQFDAWAREGSSATYAECESLEKLLRGRLEGKNIDVLDDSVSPSEYRRISFKHEVTIGPLFETDVNGGLWHCSADYMIQFQTGNGPRP